MNTTSLKNLFFFTFSFVLFLGFTACEETTIEDDGLVNANNWTERQIEIPTSDSLVAGSTYLSTYSQIYSRSEHTTHDLTVTVSMRNVSRTDSLYITAADYFDTHGELIRTYLKKPIYLIPMETVEIVINEVDKAGGTGANFIFDWHAKPDTEKPHFEAVMISTYGQQGLSFVTHGYDIRATR
ncbi:MAG: DUF3124 domain-containing protein [Saprospiraceae bacterium]